MSPRKAHQTTAQVRDGRLYSEAFPEGIPLESDEWWAFLQTGTTFYYASPTGGITVRADQRHHQLFWYAFKRHNKQLRKLYVGKIPQVTQARLDEVAAVLLQVTQDIPHEDCTISDPAQVTQIPATPKVEAPVPVAVSPARNASEPPQVTQVPLTLNRANLPVPVNELLAVCTAYHRQRHGTDWKWAGGKIDYGTSWKGGVEGYYVQHATLFEYHYLGKDRNALIDHLLDYARTGQDNVRARVTMTAKEAALLRRIDDNRNLMRKDLDTAEKVTLRRLQAKYLVRFRSEGYIPTDDGLAALGRIPKPEAVPEQSPRTAKPLAAWNELNPRQQKYLRAIYDVDQEKEAYWRSEGAKGNYDIPAASEWRWMNYHRLTTNQQLYEAIGETVIDPGTGSTFAALERRKLIETEYRYIGDSPILYIQITKTGRAAVRAALSGYEKPTRKPKGLLSEESWRALKMAYEVGEVGIPKVENIDHAYGDVSWKLWTRLMAHSPRGLVMAVERGQRPNKKGYMIITPAGRHLYEERLEQHRSAYPHLYE